MQDLLTASIELLFFAFSAIFLLDLAIALKKCWVASASMPQTQPEKKVIAQVLPDPWTLPLEPFGSKPQHQPFSAIQSKPMLLLPPAKKTSASSLHIVAEPALDRLLSSIDIDKLQLRTARKIAKALGIAQKVIKKDRPISWLKAQIKAKLQQPQELTTTVILAVQDVFAS